MKFSNYNNNFYHHSGENSYQIQPPGNYSGHQNLKKEKLKVNI